MAQIDNLKLFGSKYMRDSFTEKREKKITYSKNRLQIGRRQNGSIFYLDTSEAFHSLFIGATRAGKTFCLRSLGDRFHKLGMRLFIGTDVKNEFMSSRRPVQEEFRHLLLEGEKPTPMRVLPLRPTFFKGYDDRLPDGQKWYSPDLREMVQLDFETLVSAHEMSGAQKNALGSLFQWFKQYYRQEKEAKVNIQIFIHLLEQVDANEQTKESLRQRLIPMMRGHFHESEHEINITKLLKAGLVPALNMEGFMDMQSGTFQYPEAVLGMALREVLGFQRRDSKRKLAVFIDEAPDFIGTHKDTAVKTDITQSLRRDTAYGVHYLFATQDPKYIEEFIYKQCRYIFIPANASVDVFVSCLSRAALVDNVQIARNQSMRLKRKMNSKKHEWLIIDQTEGRYDIITFLPPLSWHKKTGE